MIVTFPDFLSLCQLPETPKPWFRFVSNSRGPSYLHSSRSCRPSYVHLLPKFLSLHLSVPFEKSLRIILLNSCGVPRPDHHPGKHRIGLIMLTKLCPLRSCARTRSQKKNVIAQARGFIKADVATLRRGEAFAAMPRRPDSATSRAHPCVFASPAFQTLRRREFIVASLHTCIFLHECFE